MNKKISKKKKIIHGPEYKVKCTSIKRNDDGYLSNKSNKLWLIVNSHTGFSEIKNKG